MTGLSLATLLSGCGVAETGAAAAGAAASAAQEAKDARKTEDRVKEQIDAAYEQAAERNRTAEKDAR